MGKLEKYTTHKESGVEWLGEIPEHWNILKSKYLHKNSKALNRKNICDNVLSLTLRGVVNNNIDSPEGLVPKDYATYQIFEKDDLVFKLIDLENISTSRVGIVHEKGIMSSAYIRLKIGQNSIPRFAYYYYYSLYINQVYNNIGSGVRSTLGPNDLLNIAYIEPPKEEQTKIASFLDEKTAQIDKAISQKEKLIELLKERRQITINEAVTKGLDKDVEFKDSGVEWIGEIPKNWGVKKLKYSVKNKTIKSMENSFKIALENIESQTTKYIETKDIVFSEAGINFNKGDVLFGKLRPYLAKVYLAEKNGLCVSEFLVLEAKKINNIFLKFLLVSDLFIRHVNSSTYGTKMPRASWDFIGNSLIPIPTKSEQLQIVKHIETQTAKIDKAIELQQNYIAKLKEYKASLIDSVVTGKVRVA